MEERKFNISVFIEGIRLPMQVANAEEEKIYRDAASNIQNRIHQLRTAYPTLNEKHHYAMAMLMTAVDSVLSSNRNDTQPFFDLMKDLEAEIDKNVKK